MTTAQTTGTTMTEAIGERDSDRLRDRLDAMRRTTTRVKYGRNGLCYQIQDVEMDDGSVTEIEVRVGYTSGVTVSRRTDDRVFPWEHMPGGVEYVNRILDGIEEAQA